MKTTPGRPTAYPQPSMPKIRNVLRSFTLLPLVAAVAACDPCAGTLGCERPSGSFQGRIATADLEEPVAGVEVTFTPHGGSPVHAVSDARGIFPLQVDAPLPGGVVGNVTVAAPGGIPYQITDLHLEPVRRGNVRTMPPWTPELVVLDLVTVFFRGDGRAAAGGTAIFRRVDGVETYPELRTLTLNAHGQAWLSLRPLSAGAVQGQWEVRVPGVERAFVSNVYAYPTEHRPRHFRNPAVPIGPVVAYRGRLVGPTGSPVEDAGVRFVRTGGLPMVGDSVFMRTGADGTFIIHPILSDGRVAGELLGRLEISPQPGLAARTVEGLTLPTFEGDEYGDLGDWSLSASPASD
jgi:hypothetical protein